MWWWGGGIGEASRASKYRGEFLIIKKEKKKSGVCRLNTSQQLLTVTLGTGTQLRGICFTPWTEAS